MKTDKSGPEQSRHVAPWDILPDNADLERLREENARLKKANQQASQYIREKVNHLLEVMGTKTLKPEELDDQSLIEFDPIGIVTDSFQLVLDNLRSTNRKLQFAHEEIQTIFDTVGAALLVLNPEKKVVAYNQKTRELLLDHDVDIHGCDCHDAVCQGQSGDTRCMFDRVVSSGREQHFQDWRFNHRCFNVIGRPMLDENGNITHVVLVYTDVTARRNAETALLEALTETQEANTKIHSILRSASDSMLITDGDDRVVLLNRQAEELLGFCLTDSNALPGIDILPNRELVCLLQQASKSGKEGLMADLLFSGPGGKDRIYQARITSITSSQGEYRGCITFLHDVTKQREIDRMKSEFVSTAAHELRTPLATIIGYTDLLLTQREQTRANLEDYLSLIQNKAERLAEIVSDLLDISRIESGEALQMNITPCPIDILCDEVIRGFKGHVKNHRFAYQSPGREIEVMADRYAFLQVLENIVSNAVKYSPNGGEIRIQVTTENGSCHLKISDQGIGMTQDQLERVFDKFYRADATNTAISGTGLGMTIVKYLVEAQSGSINLESSPNNGTTVHIRLPLAHTH